MYTGRPEDLRRKEQQAAQHATVIAEMLDRIEALGIGPVLPAQGRISGTGFEIRRVGGTWTVRA
ncbi:hypothetical protein AB4225_36585 [Streptomyces sp. 2RAF24]|uniref:hypothetical protein n=1 Tax=Streptomyces sp. 2RAF24 TaxID=3232997 RepID=UPI003F9B2812